MGIYSAGVFAFLMICNAEEVISSSSARNQLRSVPRSAVGEAAKTVILKPTNAVKPLNGAGEGCCRARALSRTLPLAGRTPGHRGGDGSGEKRRRDPGLTGGTALNL